MAWGTLTLTVGSYTVLNFNSCHDDLQLENNLGEVELDFGELVYLHVFPVLPNSHAVDVAFPEQFSDSPAHLS